MDFKTQLIKPGKKQSLRSTEMNPEDEKSKPFQLNSLAEVLDDLREGKMIILVDDEDRENEGDLVIAAEKVTPEAVNFMAREGRGLICVALTPDRLDALQIPLMVERNTARFNTAFTVSVEARRGVTTGISAHDRAQTIQTLIDPDSKPSDLVTPGHIFPLRAREGGTLVRAGQTEGSIDLARLAGMSPAAVICEIMKDDGTMARLPDLLGFAKKFDIKITSVAEIIQYRMGCETLVQKAAETEIPTDFGVFRAIAFENVLNQDVHVAMVMGEINPCEKTLVRVHSQCITGEVFRSHRCDCGEQLDSAFEMIAKEGKGVLLYLFQEGRGIGIVNKLKAYALQDQGQDTVEANQSLGFKADLRDYGIGAQILVNLGVGEIRLMTNNPRKIIGLEGYHLHIVERVSIKAEPNKHNLNYLKTKQSKLGHILGLK